MPLEPRRRIILITKCLTLFVLLAGMIGLSITACTPPKIRPLPAANHTQTHWQVQACLPLDALAFINVLTNDPLVGSHYYLARDRFLEQPTREVQGALDRLAEFRETTLQSNLSGFLYPWFMAGQPATLDDLIRLAGAPATLKDSLIKYDASLVEMNVYYSEAAWKNFGKISPDVSTVLTFLHAQNFEQYWQDEILPGLATDINRVQASLVGINIVPEIEAVTGFSLPSDEVVISLVHFEWPYGHHIIGTHLSTIPQDCG